ncbi:hypothetical protein KR093_005772 [Drosophila rubida]|uniref:Alpha 1,4-glycosyltransferase domain-containing protein n=1 Tax=Drosophila rubida TaxID=30044 RepID=A0AAD4PNT5_9MUSC|nr:hypothetical protein KR093_005772 [Drosophila rubida]
MFKTLFFLVRTRRSLLSGLGISALIYIVISTLLGVHYVTPECYMDIQINESDSVGLKKLDDVLLSEIKPRSGRSIFFHETRCHSNNGVNIFKLSARQACSIESAALNNPNLQVFIIFATPTYTSDDQKDPILDAIQSYRNVNLRYLNIWRYVKDTPIEKWFIKGDLFHSQFLPEHMSDLLRLITLYRFGGIYLDLDVVVLRSLELVPLNYVGAHDNETLGNAVISVEPRGIGHELTELLLHYYQNHYNADAYVSNGPSLISQVFFKFCNNSSVKKMQEDPANCRGFKVFNETAFFPLSWPEWPLFILPDFKNEIFERTKSSYLIHLWNKASYEDLFRVGTDNAYGRYAELHCPKTYAAAGKYF